MHLLYSIQMMSTCVGCCTLVASSVFHPPMFRNPLTKTPFLRLLALATEGSAYGAASFASKVSAKKSHRCRLLRWLTAFSGAGITLYLGKQLSPLACWRARQGLS